MEDKIILFKNKKNEKKYKKHKYLKQKRRIKKNNNKKYFNYILLFIIILVSIFIPILFFIKRTRINKLDKKINIYNKLNLENIKNIFNYSMKYEEFDENINERYKQLQNYFCENQNENLIQEYESRIIKGNVNFLGKKFDFFVYHKAKDAVSILIKRMHSWERAHTKKVLKALEYYSKKKNIENKDIYLLDIGSNIGWYTYYLGKYGYKILSFEPNRLNNYILYKNYCLNKDVSVTLINKGLDIEDNICSVKTVSSNQGDGMIYCENREKNLSDFNGEIFNGIELTKLSRYYKYLSDKNLAFIKMDVEGSEGKVIEGGKELITKYHVPFIMTEFEEKLLNVHRTEALKFLQFFIDNGYKISVIDFFSKKYKSPLEIVSNKRYNDLFIVYEKFLE